MTVDQFSLDGLASIAHQVSPGELADVLESGRYTRTTGVFQYDDQCFERVDRPYGNCCLGVLNIES